MSERTVKAAQALVALGPARAARLLQQLPEDAAAKLAAEVARIGPLDANTAKDVLADLAHELDAPKKFSLGGADYARDILARAYGVERANAMAASGCGYAADRFEYLEHARADDVVRIVGKETPPVIALALAHLSPQKAAEVIARLEPELRLDIGIRLAQLGGVAPEVIDAVDDDLRARSAELLNVHVYSFEGVSLLAQVLNNAPQEVERQLVTEMSAANAQLAELLRDALFVFDDITKLNDRAIQEILKAADTRVLATAMKGAEDHVNERIYKNLSERARQNLAEEIEFLRGVRASDIRDAQKRIVAIVRQLEEAGTIAIERAGGEDA